MEADLPVGLQSHLSEPQQHLISDSPLHTQSTVVSHPPHLTSSICSEGVSVLFSGEQRQTCDMSVYSNDMVAAPTTVSASGPRSPSNPSNVSESSAGAARRRLLQDHLHEEEEEENPFDNAAHRHGEAPAPPVIEVPAADPIPPYRPGRCRRRGQAAAAHAGIQRKYSRTNFVHRDTHHPAFQRLISKCDSRLFKVNHCSCS